MKQTRLSLVALVAILATTVACTESSDVESGGSQAVRDFVAYQDEMAKGGYTPRSAANLLALTAGQAEDVVTEDLEPYAAIGLVQSGSTRIERLELMTERAGLLTYALTIDTSAVTYVDRVGDVPRSPESRVDLQVDAMLIREQWSVVGVRFAEDGPSDAGPS